MGGTVLRGAPAVGISSVSRISSAEVVDGGPSGLSTFAWAVAFGASIAAARNIACGKQTGKLNLQTNGTELEEPRVIMLPHQRRRMGWIPNNKKSYWEKRKGNKGLSSAKARFLIRADGTVWHRQPGLNHLKNRKTKKWLQKRAKLVQIKDRRKVQKILNYTMPEFGLDNLIMRKFAAFRVGLGKGMSDNGVGTSLWT